MLVVPRVNTPLGMQALPALVEAGFRAIGRTLSPVQRVNLAALVAIETARGSAIQNGNLGNISAGESYQGAAWRPPWFEVDAGSSERMQALHVAMLAGHAPSAFRAYDSHTEGARDFAATLVRSFPSVVEAAANASADAFRRALFTSHYAPEYENPKVTATLEKLQAELGLTGGTTSALDGLVVFAVSTWLVWRLTHPRRSYVR